jgi:hypothetical protein
MEDPKRDEPEATGEEIDDLDLDESEAEDVKGGSGGNYDNAEIGKVLK